MDQPAVVQLKSLIRDVPDFPKPGIVFKDFTPLIRDAAGLAMAVELMVNPFRNKKDPGNFGGVDLVVGAESRGFIFGIALAQALSVGFIPVRKPRKLPWKTTSISYDLEYGHDTLEMHADAIEPGQRVLMVDDLLATGGTMQACCELATRMKAKIVGITVLIELEALQGRAAIKKYGPVHSVLKYD